MRAAIALLALIPLGWCNPASAQGTVITYVDAPRAAAPSYTLGVILPQVELWGFTLPNVPDIEVGRLWLVHHSKHLLLLGGGYGVSWPNSHKWFLLPWVHVEAQSGNAIFSGNVAYYAPLNGGPTILFVNEAFLGWRANNRVKLGFAAALWDQEGLAPSWGVGPSVKYRLSREISLSSRYLVGHDGNNAFRLEVARAF